MKQRDAEEQLVSSLKDQTMVLWNRLDVSAEERERVLVQTRKTYGKTVVDLVSLTSVYKLGNIR